MELSISNIIGTLERKGLENSYIGKNDLIIQSFCPLRNLTPYSITWIRDVSQSILNDIKAMPGMLVVCNPFFEIDQYKNINFIFCDNPKEVFFTILTELFNKNKERVIQPTALIKTSQIGKNCAVGHASFIDEDVIIGDNVVIENNVTIVNKVIIGDNTIIHSGAVIGKDGFGYFKKDDGISEKVPHFGGVVIGKCVEIGSNTCIDRGTLDDTIIQDYVKIDNLCHIAHNVFIGKASKVIAMSLLAGSSSFGEESYLAPGVMIKDHVVVGKQSIIGMGAMLLSDIEEKSVVIGSPAKVIRQATESDLKL